MLQWLVDDGQLAAGQGRAALHSRGNALLQETAGWQHER